MSDTTLEIKKYKQEGDMAHEYNPFRNILGEDGELEDFTTTEIEVDLNNPLNIECHPSYDGTVNLIINDDKNAPIIINNRFTKIEDDKYRIITRNQIQQTNLYNKGKINTQTRLFRNINKIPRIDLLNVGYYGRLKGGNYTFYIKYADNDYNKTDIVAESGQVSIFKGTTNIPSTVSGTLSDELTDKTISLYISNIDTTFSNIYLYYTRETGDMNGTRITDAGMFTEPYNISKKDLNIIINGFEEVESINPEELNIKYNLVTAVKTQTQVQNMLFFGNVQGITMNNRDLQNISLYIPVSLEQSEESIGYLDNNYKQQANDDVDQVEYYNPNNIYYKLGYWPGEIYRLGIVYIMNDDSLSYVYNLRGCRYDGLSDVNFDNTSSYNNLFEGTEMQYIPQNDFIDQDEYLSNTKGVFKIPDSVHPVYGTLGDQSTNPLYFKINITDEIKNTLKSYGVKGYFIVRQKRIPTILCQGLAIGVDKVSYLPMIPDVGASRYLIEGFLNSEGILSTDSSDRIKSTPYKQTSGLLSLDPCINPILKSTFDGTQFVIQKSKDMGDSFARGSKRYYYNSYNIPDSISKMTKASTIFIDSDVPLLFAEGKSFSTRAGSAEEAQQFKFFGDRDYSKNNYNLIRGIFSPFLGLSTTLDDNCVYNVRIQNYSTVFEEEYFQIRGNDNSSFFAISDRYALDYIEGDHMLDIYRGDCYTNTVSIRLQRNFIDPDVPTNEIIIDSNTWRNNYNGYNTTSAEDWLNVNRADLNTVPIGTWITFKCLSNFNLGLRSQDPTNVDEQAIMGSPRTFFPLSVVSTETPTKIEESWLLNDGYNTTLGQKRNFALPNVPYIKDLFDNRIMFSNVQIDDDFRNAYRIFQGLSYKDIDRQYGAIVKLIPWGVHLFCVFEHGLGIIPINEKALIQTDTDQSIHMYGAGVIQNQITLISPDFGSIWQESIIRTPVGIYGVDTFAKKVWRFSQDKGLELISDMKIQRFLNDNITLREKDKYPTIALKNVKSHYNNYKGDVMFTFYNEDKVWNLCYNERLDRWVTRYSWTPLYSENINNVFYSLDKKRAEVLAFIYDNQHTTSGLRLEKNEWDNLNSNFSSNLWFEGYDFYDTFRYTINSVISSYIDDNGVEQIINLPTDSFVINEEESIITANNSILNYNNHILYYFKINLLISPRTIVEGEEILGASFSENIGIVLNYNNLSNTQKNEYSELLVNGFYVHGRSGIFDEINYKDNNPKNQILPTKWYDKQEPFEFEFVVNNLTGMHKIFNDLVIISNNVEPKSFEFEIIGDVYDFNKSGIYKQTHFPEDNEEFNQIINPKGISQEFKNAEIKYDDVTNEYSLVIEQPSLNIKNRNAGRLLGNIQYKEDAWYSVIEPIKFKNKTPDFIEPTWKSTRIRDKFLKIRVKYSGEKLAIITALKTLMTVSYS